MKCISTFMYKCLVCLVVVVTIGTSIDMVGMKSDAWGDQQNKFPSAPERTRSLPNLFSCFSCLQAEQANLPKFTDVRMCQGGYEKGSVIGFDKINDNACIKGFLPLLLYNQRIIDAVSDVCKYKIIEQLDRIIENQAHDFEKSLSVPLKHKDFCDDYVLDSDHTMKNFAHSLMTGKFFVLDLMGIVNHKQNNDLIKKLFFDRFVPCMVVREYFKIILALHEKSSKKNDAQCIYLQKNGWRINVECLNNWLIAYAKCTDQSNMDDLSSALIGAVVVVCNSMIECSKEKPSAVKALKNLRSCMTMLFEDCKRCQSCAAETNKNVVRNNIININRTVSGIPPVTVDGVIDIKKEFLNVLCQQKKYFDFCCNESCEGKVKGGDDDLFNQKTIHQNNTIIKNFPLILCISLNHGSMQQCRKNSVKPISFPMYGLVLADPKNEYLYDLVGLCSYGYGEHDGYWKSYVLNDNRWWSIDGDEISNGSAVERQIAEWSIGENHTSKETPVFLMYDRRCSSRHRPVIYSRAMSQKNIHYGVAHNESSIPLHLPDYLFSGK